MTQIFRIREVQHNGKEEFWRPLCERAFPELPRAGDQFDHDGRRYQVLLIHFEVDPVVVVQAKAFKTYLSP